MAILSSSAFPPKTKFWFLCSLAIAVAMALSSIVHSFSHEYIVQDDARQHVFWMQRFLDGDLFPNDLIADYFQSVAPPGYTALYQMFAQFGISPLVLAKLLPLVLALVATGYCFATTLLFVPLPFAGFTTSVLLNSTLWLEDDLVSATPRAFIYPLFLAFLYYLLRRDRVLCCLSMALLGLFYPQMALVAMATLILYLWRSQPTRSVSVLGDAIFGIVSVAIVVAVLLPYKLSPQDFGEIISIDRARSMLEFNTVGDGYGRAFYFHDNPLIFWLAAPRSGLLFWGVMTPLNLFAFTLPILLAQPGRYPLARKVSPDILILIEIVLAAVGWFFISHAIAFQLHFPNRYIYHSVRMVLPLAAGIAIAIWLDTQWYFWLRSRMLKLEKTRFVFPMVSIILGFLVAVVPFVTSIAIDNQLYVRGKPAELYEFLQQQPKDTVVASVTGEANDIPTFARRSILIGEQYALPYHTGYYDRFRQRVLDFITAQYTPNLEIVKQFIRKYDVDFILIDINPYTVEYLQTRPWLQQYESATRQAIAHLENGDFPALLTTVDRCSVLPMEELILLDTNCILSQ